MRRPWLAYLLTAIASVGIGIAIAGLPDSLPGKRQDAPAATFTPSTTSTVPTTSAAATSTAPATSSTSTTSTTSTRSTTSTTPATTTTAPSSTTSSTSSTPTSASSAVVEARVAVANGVGVAGLAANAADLLLADGFTSVVALDTTPVVESTVFYGPGFQAAATRIAAALGLRTESVEGLQAAPALSPPGEFDVVVALGADRAP